MVHLMADQKENWMVGFKAPGLARRKGHMMEHPTEHQKAPGMVRMMIQLMEYPKEQQKESPKVRSVRRFGGRFRGRVQ